MISVFRKWVAVGEILILSTLAWPLSRNAFSEEREIRRGDTLSEIARDVSKLPTYGSHGGLNKILKINPEIKNPNLIVPGERIKLPGSTAATVKTSEPLKPAEPAPPSSVPEPKPVTSLETAPGNQSVAAAAPSPVREKRKTFAFTPFFGRGQTSGLTSTGQGLPRLSNLGEGASLAYFQHWTPSWSSFLEVGVQRWSLSAIGAAVENPIHTVGRFDVGLESRVGESWNVGGSVGVAPELNFHGVSPFQNVAIDVLTVPEFAFWQRVQLRHITLNPSLTFTEGVSLPVATPIYNASASPFVGVRLGVSPMIDQQFFDLGAYFKYRAQQTTLTDTQTTEVGLELALNFNLRR
jgi:hypothetical protein